MTTTHGDTAAYVKHTCQDPPLPTSKLTCQDPGLPISKQTCQDPRLPMSKPTPQNPPLPISKHTRQDRRLSISLLWQRTLTESNGFRWEFGARTPARVSKVESFARLASLGARFQCGVHVCVNFCVTDGAPRSPRFARLVSLTSLGVRFQCGVHYCFCGCLHFCVTGEAPR